MNIYNKVISEMMVLIESSSLQAVEQRKCTYPERIGQPECKFYLKFGLCKFGPICKFHHPKVRVGINEVQLNSHGYPLRPHVNECFTYLRSGWCKFGDICKYNHPEQSNSPFLLSLMTSGQQSYPGGLTSFYASPHCQDPSSYAQTIIPEGLVQLQSWNTFPQQKSGNGQFAGTSRQSISAIGYSASFSSSQFGSSPEGKSWLQRGGIFPVRPGEPDCPFFKKTGDCKFGAMCRFHHPIEKLIHTPDCMLSPEGFPLRPGKSQCIFYSRHGTCKYGPTCKFDHPIAVPKGTVTASLSTSSSFDVSVCSTSIGVIIGPPVLTLSSESSPVAIDLINLSNSQQINSDDEKGESDG